VVMMKALLHKVMKGLAVAGVAGIGLATIIATNGNNGATDTQAYALAYTALSDRTIKVRGSTDGSNWQDYRVPAQDWASGLAMAATPDQLMYQIAGWNTSTKLINVVQGLGLANWADRPIAAVSPEQAKAAPAMTFLGSGKWLVVYRTDSHDPNLGDKIAARILDTSTTPPRYLTSNVFGFPGQDTRTQGRPAVAYVSGKLVLAWQTQSAAQPGMHVGVGNVVNGEIAWDRHIFLPLNEPNVCNAVRSDPVLTHDHQGFYLAFLCSRQGSTSNGLYILRSTDGYTWSFYGSWLNLPNGIPANAYTGLAGRADGSLIALAITPDQGELAARCAGGTACIEQGNTVWQSLDARQFFPSTPSYLPFAFITVGMTAN
jgi:hypothetical protein